MSAILFSGTIGPVPVDIIIKENHSSKVTVTENAIENGAKVHDHAHVESKKLSLEFAASNAVATYNALVRFQEERKPFTMVSGLFVYKNMIIIDIDADRDAKTSRVLKGTVELQEVKIVETAKAASDKKDGKDGGKKSTKSSTPSKDKAADGTKDKASGTVNRGDTGAKTMTSGENQSLASKAFGSGKPERFGLTGHAAPGWDGGASP